MRMLKVCSILATAMILISSNCFAAGLAQDALTFQVIQASMNFDSVNVESATVIQAIDKKYGLEIKLTPAAAAEMGRLTHAGIGKIATMVFDGKIISTATIASQMNGDFMVSGLTKEQAENIAHSINRK